MEESAEWNISAPPPTTPNFRVFVWDWEEAQKCFILRDQTTGDFKSHHLQARVTLTALSVLPRPPFLSAELLCGWTFSRALRASLGGGGGHVPPPLVSGTVYIETHTTCDFQGVGVRSLYPPWIRAWVYPLCRLKNPTVISIWLLVGFHPATRSVLSTPADNTRKRVWQYIEKERKTLSPVLQISSTKMVQGKITWMLGVSISFYLAEFEIKLHKFYCCMMAHVGIFPFKLPINSVELLLLYQW